MKKDFDKEKKVNLSQVIIDQLGEIKQGSLSIIVQDGKVLQMNIDESYDFDDEEKKQKEKSTIKEYNKSTETNITPDLVGDIVKVINSIKYGHLTVSVNQGQIIEYEKNEKFRVR